MVGGVRRSLKVFLCHASGDKPSVREFYKRLVSEGVDAWLDKEKLLPGQDWRVEIPRAVEEADVVIVFLSKRSVTKEGYVQKEIKFALDVAEEKPEGTIFLIPARIEDCTVPERLGRWQWVDLYEEDGYAKLLRSLRLRADRVGAVIEPSSFIDTDKERERRLDQLYTEGLAAFYTEEWEKACQRFRVILNEQPNHPGATEKLAEAERQRTLSDLYARSLDAYKVESWPMAIKLLEELLQKSAEYRDAGQLLRNARKQKQLKGLYAEARTLHSSQKWQAVVKVFEQIASIDASYPDPDNLLATARKEEAALQVLAEFNDLYRQAVREMDAGQWVKARTLLERIDKSPINFPETERLLKKAEAEIEKIEENQKRNDQVNTLYEQAHGLARSKKWRRALGKIEEIKNLDEQFVDKDEISSKAKMELEREEGEAQRQNELAAMYAEAVRLLKEEKYQEALDKWQEVKKLDSKYPDRQWVQRTARKKLVNVARPVAISTPRISLTKVRMEWLILPAALGFGLARLAQLNLGSLFQVDIPNEFGWALRGALHGLIVAFMLQLVIQQRGWKSILISATCWAIVYIIGWVQLAYQNILLTSLVLASAPGLSALFMNGLGKAQQSWRINSFVFIGWILAWLIGQNAGGMISHTLNWAICDAIAGGIGLWIMIDLSKPQSAEADSAVDSKQKQKPVRLLLLAILGAIIIRAIWGLFQNLLHIWDVESPTVTQFIFLFVLGGCYGAVVGFSLKKLIPGWGLKHSITVTIGWALGLGTVIYSGSIGLEFISSAMAVCGLSTAVAVKWAQPSTSPLKITLIFVCWALAWQYGNMLGGYLVEVFGNDYTWCIADTLTILLGLVATYGIYEYSAIKPTKQTILSALVFVIFIMIVPIVTNPTVYDGFDSPLHNNSYNRSSWRMEVSDSRNVASQQNGSMLLTSNGYESNISLYSVKYYSKAITSPTFIEASFRLEPNQNGGAGISVHMNGRAAFLTCQVWGMNGSQVIACQAPNFYQSIQDIKIINISPGTQHSARIEVDPSTPTFTFYIDGEKVGEYTPPQANSYQSAKYFFVFSSGCGGDGCNDHSTSRVVEGYFDYVKIGPVP
jgi:outer membrane protein assembly factor BamD (BamD/ComL family)